jgi:hypothetical protein
MTTVIAADITREGARRSPFGCSSSTADAGSVANCGPRARARRGATFRFRLPICSTPAALP